MEEVQPYRRIYMTRESRAEVEENIDLTLRHVLLSLIFAIAFAMNISPTDNNEEIKRNIKKIYGGECEIYTDISEID